MVKSMLAKDVMSEKFAVMYEDMPLSKAITIFDEEEPDAIIIFSRDNEYLGVLAERWIYRARLDPTKTKARTLTRHVPKVRPEENLPSVAKKILENRVPVVPVFDGDELVGTVSDIDLLFKVVEKEFGDLKAIDFATKELITLLPEDSVAKAVAIFRDNNISRAPIIDKGKIIGIITLHDVVVRFIIPRQRAKFGDLKGEKIRPLSTPVKNVMSSPVIYIGPEGTIREVVHLMKEHDISSVLILDEAGKGLGIITKTDLIEALVKYAGMEEEKRVFYQLAGDYEYIDGFEMEIIKEDLDRFVDKMERMFDEGTLFVHLKQIKRERGNRFIVRTRFITPGNVYVARSEGFGALNVLQVVLDKLEREILADKERRLEEERTKLIEKEEFWL